jgi:hypothetical protein
MIPNFQSLKEKNTTMAEPFAGPGGMAMGINSRPPPATSSRWVGRGRIQRNLFNYVNRLRKKII